MELKIGTVYRLHARNIHVGVFDGRGFIGIREKFGEHYLDMEFPRENRGTATAKEELGVIENAPLVMSLGTQCQACGKPAHWTGPPSPAPWACESGCAEVWPLHVSNRALFLELQKYESTTEGA